MYALVLTLFALSLSLAPRPALHAQGREREGWAVAELEKAKGWVQVDERRTGKPVTRVDLSGAPAPSKKWARLLRSFPQLEEFSAC